MYLFYFKYSITIRYINGVVSNKVFFLSIFQVHIQSFGHVWLSWVRLRDKNVQCNLYEIRIPTMQQKTKWLESIVASYMHQIKWFSVFFFKFPKNMGPRPLSTDHFPFSLDLCFRFVIFPQWSVPCALDSFVIFNVLYGRLPFMGAYSLAIK